MDIIQGMGILMDRNFLVDVIPRPFGSHSFVLEIRCLTCKTELGFAQERSSELHSGKKEEDTL